MGDPLRSRPDVTGLSGEVLRERPLDRVYGSSLDLHRGPVREPGAHARGHGEHPAHRGHARALTFISENKSDIDCIIISDSNTVFIDWVLHASGLKSAIDDVFTNPANIDARGYVSVRCFHAHDCTQCPINLCKRRVLHDFRENQAKAGVHYERICYIGDGGNDFCPIKELREGDIAMPRKGFTLEKLLCKAISEGPEALGAKIMPWTSGNEILRELRALIE